MEENPGSDASLLLLLSLRSGHRAPSVGDANMRIMRQTEELVLKIGELHFQLCKTLVGPGIVLLELRVGFVVRGGWL